jgi:hypothetical protein
LVFTLWCLALAGCSKCGKPAAVVPGPELTRYLPKDAQAALVVPDLGAVGEKLKVLEALKIAAFVAQLQGFGDAHEYAQALMGQLGVDLRSREELAKIGLDPSRGLAVAVLDQEKFYTVVGLKDAAKLEAFLLSLAKNRLGAGVTNTRTENGVKLTWFSQMTGTAPRLGFIVQDGFAFIAAESSVMGLPGFVALPAEKSLAKDAALAAQLARLPAARDLWAYVPPTSQLAKEGPLGGGAFAVTLTADALTVKADLPWPLDEKALGSLEAKPGADLLPLLPPDAFLAARFSGDPKLVATYWGKLVGPHLLIAFNNSGFDFKGEVLDNLKPGAVAALSVAPEAKLGAGMPELDVRRTNPFRYVHLTAAGDLADPAKGLATLEKLPAIAPSFGAKIEAADKFGQKVFVTTYSQGEGVHFAQAADKVVAGAPLARLEEMLTRLGKKGDVGPGAIPDPSLKKAFEGHGVAAVVDLRRLAESVKALPSEAWGIGGFAYKATTVRWLDATDDLRAVTLSLDSKERALQGELTLRFEKK